MGKVRDKLAYEQAQTSKLKDKLADSEAAKIQAVNSKSESDAKIRDQTKRIDDLGKELLKAMSVSKNAEIQSKESNKVKGDTVRETRRLLEENEQLQNEVRSKIYVPLFFSLLYLYSTAIRFAHESIKLNFNYQQLLVERLNSSSEAHGP